MNWAELVKSKTFWTAIGGMVTTIGACVQGAMDWKSAIMPILVSLIGLFLKDGQIKQANETKALLARLAKP
jgi:hypothetical protein